MTPTVPPTPVATERLWARLAAKPHAFDLFMALRRIEGAHLTLPRLGTALKPRDEPVRFAQDPTLSFPPAPIAEVTPPGTGPARLVQRVVGLLGANGALPTHLTEYVRERTLHHGDPTLQRFMDMLLHRFGLLLYRAWTRSQPAAMLDRADDAAIERWLGSLIGLGLPALRQRDALHDHARLFFAGRLARQVRDADGLQAWISLQFGVPVQVRQCQGHWMPLHPDDRSRLSRYGQPALGRGAVLGRQVWDVQHKFRIVLGPLDLADYQRFLPGGPALQVLRDLVRQYVGLEFEWDLQLILRHDNVPSWSLGRRAGVAGHLGRASWLASRQRERDADQLVVHVERLPAPRPPSPPSNHR